MSSYRLKCRKNSKSKKPKNCKNYKRQTNAFIKIKVCNSIKYKLIKEQEASGLSSNLGIKTALNKIPLLGPISLTGIK